VRRRAAEQLERPVGDGQRHAVGRQLPCDPFAQGGHRDAVGVARCDRVQVVPRLQPELGCDRVPPAREVVGLVARIVAVGRLHRVQHDFADRRLLRRPELPADPAREQVDLARRRHQGGDGARAAGGHARGERVQALESVLGPDPLVAHDHAAQVVQRVLAVVIEVHPGRLAVALGTALVEPVAEHRLEAAADVVGPPRVVGPHAALEVPGEVRDPVRDLLPVGAEAGARHEAGVLGDDGVAESGVPRIEPYRRRLVGLAVARGVLRRCADRTRGGGFEGQVEGGRERACAVDGGHTGSGGGFDAAEWRARAPVPAGAAGNRCVPAGHSGCSTAARRGQPTKPSRSYQ
jgi:hypothetical protein